MIGAMSPPSRVRHVVRVLLLDEQDRLLLFRSGRRAWWQPPGGGIERREDVRAAAAREILEETGLAQLDLGASCSSTGRRPRRWTRAADRPVRGSTRRFERPPPG